MSSSQTQRCADSAADNTQRLNQSSFASSSLSYFTTFPLICRWGNKDLSSEKLYFFSFAPIIEQGFFWTAEFFQKAWLWKVWAGPAGPRGSLKPGPSRDSHQTAAYPPTGTHCKWYMHECCKTKARVASHKNAVAGQTVGSPQEFSSKDIATNVIRVSSYEMEKSGHGPSVKCLNKPLTAKASFYCSEWSEIDGWAFTFTTQ